MVRWVALAMTLVCFGSCSFMSQSVFRGMVAPIGVIVFGLVTLLLFVHARVRGSARPPGAALLDVETQALMRQRAAANAARDRAAGEASPGAPDRGSKSPGGSH